MQAHRPLTGGCAQVSRDAPPLRQTSVAALRSTVEVARTAPPLVRQVTREVGLSRQAQAPSLHVGERVRVKRSVSKPSYEWGSVSHSSVGTITSVGSNGDCAVCFPEHSSWRGKLSEMERAPTTSTSISSPGVRPTIGDLVVVRTHGGQRGKIIEDDGAGDSRPYKVQFDNGDTHWYPADDVQRADSTRATRLRGEVGLSRQAPAALLAGAGAAGASVQGDDLLEAAAGFVGDQVTGMVVVAPVLSLLQKWSKLDLLRSLGQF